MLFLSFGPLLVCRYRRPAALAVGARATGRRRGHWSSAALAFYFLADVPDMGGVWVGWRSGTCC